MTMISKDHPQLREHYQMENKNNLCYSMTPELGVMKPGFCPLKLQNMSILLNLELVSSHVERGNGVPYSVHTELLRPNEILQMKYPIN